MKTLTSKAGATAVAVVLASTLIACGGGDGGDGGDAFINDQFGPANPANCPKAVLSDIWINNRLSCLGAGQPFVNLGAAAVAAKSDRAFIVSQDASDQNLNSLLGVGVARHFKRFLCIRNAPEGLSGQAAASDLATALGFGSVLRIQYLPPGVAGSGLNIGGGREAPTVEMACNQAVHPVIVDFNTGKIESVNVAALASLQINDY